MDIEIQSSEAGRSRSRRGVLFFWVGWSGLEVDVKAGYRRTERRSELRIVRYVAWSRMGGLETRKWDGGLVRRRLTLTTHPHHLGPPAGAPNRTKVYFRTFHTVLHKAPNL